MTFVERDPRAAALIAENTKTCGVEGDYTIQCAEFAAALPTADAFDLILLDPPYDIADVSVTLDAAARRVAPGGLIVLERATRCEFEAPRGLRRTRDAFRAAY